MILLFIWLFFGLIVGLISKFLHPGDEPIGCLPTVLIGIGGSFVGGGINWVLAKGNTPFTPSGFLMSIVGGILCCVAWRWYSLKSSVSGPKNFFTGKKIR